MHHINGGCCQLNTAEGKILSGIILFGHDSFLNFLIKLKMGVGK